MINNFIVEKIEKIEKLLDIYFYFLSGTFSSHYTVFEHYTKYLPDDGTGVQDLDKFHRVAHLWQVFLHLIKLIFLAI